MLTSTDHNLNNPMSVDEIDVYNNFDSVKLPKVEHLMKAQFDLIAMKDPETIYIITDTYQVFRGEFEIKYEVPKVKYLLGGMDSNKEYVLYMNESNVTKNNLIPIMRFKDIRVAVKTLNQLNYTGSHNRLSLDIANILRSYLDKNISLHEFVIGVLSASGYKRSMKLQEFLSRIHNYGAEDKNVFFHDEIYRKLVEKEIGRTKNELFQKYVILYDLMREYDFFHNRKYRDHLQDLDLSPFIFHIERVL